MQPMASVNQEIFFMAVVLRGILHQVACTPYLWPLDACFLFVLASLDFIRKLPKGASLHSLRHSHCSHLLASGVPLPAVSARLGHGSIRTTQEIYSHMIHGQDDEAARKWEEFQNQPAGGEPQQKGRVQ